MSWTKHLKGNERISPTNFRQTTDCSAFDSECYGVASPQQADQFQISQPTTSFKFLFKTYVRYCLVINKGKV